jgi:hypothetical protein
MYLPSNHSNKKCRRHIPGRQQKQMKYGWKGGSMGTLVPYVTHTRLNPR